MDYTGVLDVLTDGFGFIRGDIPENDVYVSNSIIKRFQLRTGDLVCCDVENGNGKFNAVSFVHSINGDRPEKSIGRRRYDELTPIFPNMRIHLGGSDAMKLVDVVAPIGKGQRGIIVAPPKAGKTTLLKDMAKSIMRYDPEMEMIILLVDERPEEVTDLKEELCPLLKRINIIASTFDEKPENHIKVAERTIERAKRMVEMGKDVTILFDSITRLARAYNVTMPPSGKTLSGGIDPIALTAPKKFFGAARNLKEGGSLTIIATALIETGSKMDDVIYEEFKGTGNMELVLDRRLQEKRIFPAIDIKKSGTRRDDLLQNPEERRLAADIRNSEHPIKYFYECA